MSSLQSNVWSGGQTSRLPSLITSIPIPREIRKPSPSRLSVSRPSLPVPTMSPSSSPCSQRRAAIAKPRPTPRSTGSSPTRAINSKPASKCRSVISTNSTTTLPLNDLAKQLAKYFTEHNQEQKHRVLAELCNWCQQDGLKAYSGAVHLLNQFQFLYVPSGESYIAVLVAELTTASSKSSDHQYAAAIVDLFNHLVLLAPNQKEKMLIRSQLIASGFESIQRQILAEPDSHRALVYSITRYNEMLLADLRCSFASLEENFSHSSSHLFGLMSLVSSKLAVSSLDESSQAILVKLLRKIATLLWPERTSSESASTTQVTHLLRLIDRYFDLLTMEQSAPSPIELAKMLDNLLRELDMPQRNGDKCSATFEANADSSCSSISSLSCLSTSPSTSLSSLENTHQFSSLLLNAELATTKHISTSSALSEHGSAVSAPPPSLPTSSLPPPPPPPPPPPIISTQSISIKRKPSVPNGSQKHSVHPNSPLPCSSENGADCPAAYADVLAKKPKAKMKTINWTKIPMNAIGTSDSDQQPNVWQLIGQKLSKDVKNTASCEQTESQQLVDFEQLEELFCLATAPLSNGSNHSGNGNLQLQPSASSCPSSPQITRRTSCGPSLSSDQSSDSSLSLDHVVSMSHSNEQQPEQPASLTGDLSYQPVRSHVEPQIAFLDSKRTLSVNIFLKQYRGASLEEIIDLIKEGKHDDIGLEKLRSLRSLLPTESEIVLLRKHASEITRMPLAERFLCILIGLRHYRLKIEFMLLRQECANMPALRRATSCVRKAAYELMRSEKLQEILTLVLVSGNFLNFGSYAGDAIGFKITSLPKLAEIRSNKAGLNMIHYVAMQAEKRGLANFSEDLPNLKEASKISIENLKVEVRSLSDKISGIKSKLVGQGDEQDDQLFASIKEFLAESDQCIERLKEETEQDMELLRQKVAKFFCEDVAQFKIEECLRIFVVFEQRFKIAMEDNRKRIEHQQKIKTRQLNVIQSCGQLTPAIEPLKLMSRSLESSNGSGSTLERTASLNRRRSRPNSQDVSDLHSNLVEFLNQSCLEQPNIDGNLFGSNFRRVGSGRRSSRSLVNSSTSSTILEESRSNEEETMPKSANESELVSANFNRFSPFRRTLNCRSARDGTETTKNFKVKYFQPNEQEPLASSSSKEVLDSQTSTKSNTIPVIRISPEEPGVSQEEEPVESKRPLEALKQLPVISNLRKSPSQYIQQLTAIISPTKFIESNDALHQQFGSATGGNASTDVNIIVSTVAKERPTTLPNAFTMRRTPSFVLGADGKATTPVNAAIVMPMQKVDQLSSENTAFNHATEKKSRLERKGSQYKTSSLSNSLPLPDSSSSKSTSIKSSSIPTPSKTVVSSSRAKVHGSSISSRQQSAVDKRIAWARNGHSSLNSTAQRPPLSSGHSKVGYRTPSTISRTNFNSDYGSMVSLQRASQLGTLSSSKSLDSGSRIPQTNAKSNQHGFMKPTSSSSAKTRV